MINYSIKYFVIFYFLLILGACQDNNDEQRVNKLSDREDLGKILEESNKLLLAFENQEIEDFVDRHALDVEKTGSGLRYSINIEGEGPEARKGMTAIIDYRIRLLTGDVIYCSEEQGAKEFEIGRGGVESGLEEGILMLRKGDEATFIMPAHLAHGVPGDGFKIPKRAAIVYDLKLIDLK